MTRTLPGSMPTNIGKAITNPIFLVEIDFTATNYYSSREQIAYDSGSGSNNYAPDRLEVRRIASDRAEIALANDDRAVTAAALQGQIRGNQVKIFLYYEGDAILRFVGEVDSFETQDDDRGSWVVFKVTSITALKARWPNERIGPPEFNFLPQAGLQFQYGNTIYIVEANPD